MRATILFKTEMQVGHNFCGDKLALEKVYGTRIHPSRISFMFVTEDNPHMNQDSDTGLVTVQLQDTVDIKISNDEYKY